MLLMKVMKPESALWLLARLLHGLAIVRPTENQWQQPQIVLTHALTSSCRVMPISPAEKEWEVSLPQQNEVLTDLASYLSTWQLTNIEHDLLAPLYEKVVARHSRRRCGAFMTPPQVIDLILWLAGAAQITPDGNLVASSASSVDEGWVLDPAAGTGAFVVRLLALARRTGKREVVADLLAKLCAIEKTTLPAFILCINAAIQWALIDDNKENSLPVLHVGQADSLQTYTPFNNQKQLNIMGVWWHVVQERTDFSLVMGNPPYVGESGNKEVFAPYRRQKMWAEHIQGKMDFLQLFIVLGLSKIQDREGGRLCFITSAYWLTADGASKLRALILSQARIHTVVFFNNRAVFTNAPGHDSIIILLERCSSATCRAANRIQLIEVESGGELPLVNRVAAALKGEQTGVRARMSAFTQGMLTSEPWHLKLGESDLKVLCTIEQGSLLHHYFRVRQGLAPGAQRVDSSALAALGSDWVRNNNVKLGEGIFVLNDEELANLQLTEHEKTLLRPFVKNSAIKPYAVIPEQSLWLIYLNHKQECGDCHNFLAHLQRFRPLLERKRELGKGGREWYHLHWPREESVFANEKVMTAQRGERPAFAWCDKPLYAATDVYFIQPKQESVHFSLLALTAILNSSLSVFWFNHRAKAKGKQREYFSKTLEEFPLPVLDTKQVKSKKMLRQLERNAHLLHRRQLAGSYAKRAVRKREWLIDEIVFELYALPAPLRAYIRTSAK